MPVDTEDSDGSAASESQGEVPREMEEAAEEVAEEVIDNTYTDIADLGLKVDMDLLRRKQAGAAVEGSAVAEAIHQKHDFDIWLAKKNKIVERYPDYFYFRVYRTYPEFDTAGNYIKGWTRVKAHKPISLEWMEQTFPGGGRFDVKFCGPRDGTTGAVLATYMTLSVASQDGNDPTSLPVTPIVAGNEQGNMTAQPKTPTETVALPASLAEKLVMRYVDGLERRAEVPASPVQGPTQGSPAPSTQDSDGVGQHGPRPPRFRRFLGDAGDVGGDTRPPWSRTPFVPPTFRDESPMTKAFEKMLDVFTTKTETPQVTPAPAERADHPEVARLHALLAKMQEDQRKEVADRLREQRESLDSQMSAQRDSYEKLLAEARKQATDAASSGTSRHTDEVTRLATSHKDRVDMLESRIADIKDELRTLRDENSRLRSDLHTAQTNEVVAKSELAALRTTKDSEIKAVQAEERAKAAETAMSKHKPEDDDPITGLVKKITQAKSLSETLSQSLGGDKGGDVKPSRVDSLIEVATKIAGSPDIRKLAGAVTEAAAKGISTVVRSSQERRSSQVPSTTSMLAASYQTKMAERRASVVAPAPVVSLPSSAPTEVSGLVGASAPESIVDVIADASDALAKAGEEANRLLDDIEDFSAMEEPIEKSAEVMLERIQVLSGEPRSEVLKSIRGATAAKTLADMGLPPTRLSTSASAYLDAMIKHAETLKE